MPGTPVGSLSCIPSAAACDEPSEFDAGPALAAGQHKEQPDAHQQHSSHPSLSKRSEMKSAEHTFEPDLSAYFPTAHLGSRPDSESMPLPPLPFALPLLPELTLERAGDLIDTAAPTPPEPRSESDSPPSLAPSRSLLRPVPRPIQVGLPLPRSDSSSSSASEDGIGAVMGVTPNTLAQRRHVRKDSFGAGGAGTASPSLRALYASSDPELRFVSSYAAATSGCMRQNQLARRDPHVVGRLLQHFLLSFLSRFWRLVLLAVFLLALVQKLELQGVAWRAVPFALLVFVVHHSRLMLSRLRSELSPAPPLPFFSFFKHPRLLTRAKALPVAKMYGPPALACVSPGMQWAREEIFAQPSEGYCGQASVNNMLGSIPLPLCVAAISTPHGSISTPMNGTTRRFFVSLPPVVRPFSLTEMELYLSQLRAASPLLSISISSVESLTWEGDEAGYASFLSMMCESANDPHQRLLVNFLRTPLFYCREDSSSVCKSGKGKSDETSSPSSSNHSTSPTVASVSLARKLFSGHWSPLLGWIEPAEVERVLSRCAAGGCVTPGTPGGSYSYPCSPALKSVISPAWPTSSSSSASMALRSTSSPALASTAVPATTSVPPLHPPSQSQSPPRVTNRLAAGSLSPIPSPEPSTPAAPAGTATAPGSVELPDAPSPAGLLQTAVDLARDGTSPPLNVATPCMPAMPRAASQPTTSGSGCTNSNGEDSTPTTTSAPNSTVLRSRRANSTRPPLPHSLPHLLLRSSSESSVLPGSASPALHPSFSPSSVHSFPVSHPSERASLSDGLFLIADVNPAYGHYLVPPRRLYDAVCTLNLLSGESRGIIRINLNLS